MTDQDPQADYYRGIKMIRYDLVKEFFLAFVAVAIIVIGAAALFSSPDDPTVTLKTWSVADPVDFVSTAAAELSYSSDTAGYGPPYTNAADGAQQIGPISPQTWGGVSIPIDTAQDFVLKPLSAAAVGNESLTSALQAYNSSTQNQKDTWNTNYAIALANATIVSNHVNVGAGDFGPVPALMSGLLDLAQTGALDSLLTDQGAVYGANSTLPLLFLGDGNYMADQADANHLSGDQWGMMNEMGNYPGQVWLAPMSFWYQISPFNSEDSTIWSDNADLLIAGIVMLLLLVLLLVPFIPIVRDIPRWVPIHRLIWRRYYRDRGAGSAK
jgi:hypothetical protein